MIYLESDNAQIQASYAARCGLLLEQYLTLAGTLATEDRLEVTASLALANTLLPIYSEWKTHFPRQTRQRLERDAQDFFKAELNQSPGSLESTFVEPLTGALVLEQLRHAMSHPVPRTRPGGLPTTGYELGPHPEGETQIQSITFTTSPWIYKGRVSAQEERRANAFLAGYPGAELESTGSGRRRRYYVTLNRERIYPYLSITLSPGALVELVRWLSNLLAQPLDSTYVHRQGRPRTTHDLHRDYSFAAWGRR